MTKKILVDDVIGCTSTCELFGAYGKGECKGMFMVTTILGSSCISVEYIVVEQRKEILKTNDLNHAIRTYNKAY